MSVYRRGDIYYVELRWRGYPRVRISAQTTRKANAEAMESTLKELRARGYRDVIEAVAAGRVKVVDVHAAYAEGPEALRDILNAERSPELTLGELFDEWIAWVDSSIGLSPRTGRRFSGHTVKRYRDSFTVLFRDLPNGRRTRVDQLTESVLADFRAHRIGNGTSPSTVNRDLVAVRSMWSWCREHKHLAMPNLRFAHEKEAASRERYLECHEVELLQQHLPTEWWPLFATLLFTGIRISEAQGLRWEDVSFNDQRISIHEDRRRLKTVSSRRDVPIAKDLEVVLRKHLQHFPGSGTDPVFPVELGVYQAARRAWRRTCLDAGIHDHGHPPRPSATIHDLRHTFAVRAAQAGVPLARLQKLLGHKTSAMTMRYAAHAPDTYFSADAAAVALAIRGELAQPERRSRNAPTSKPTQAKSRRSRGPRIRRRSSGLHGRHR